MNQEDQSSGYAGPLYRCAKCGAMNRIVNQGRGDPNNLARQIPTRVARTGRAYQRGYMARQRKEQGCVWLEPHLPPEDADLAQAWLEGWSDKDAEIKSAGDERE